MAISNKRFLLGGALAGLADAFYANGGLQPQAMGQFIARDDMMREKDEEDQRRRAMQQSLLGVVDKAATGHLSRSINPVMGRPTPELAAGQDPRMDMARQLIRSGEPALMQMGMQQALARPEREQDKFMEVDGRLVRIPAGGGNPTVALDKLKSPGKYVMIYNVATGMGRPVEEGSELYTKALDSELYSLDKPSEGPKNEWQILSKDDAKAKGLPEGPTYKINLKTGDVQKVTEPNQTAEEKRQGLIELETALTDFGNLLGKYGTETTIPVLRDTKRLGELRGSRARILVAVKKAEQTGTLDKGTMDFFEQVLADPTGMAPAFSNDKDMIMGQLGQLYAKLGKEMPDFGGNGLPKPTSQQEFDALPSGAEYIDPDDGKLYRKP